MLFTLRTTTVTSPPAERPQATGWRKMAFRLLMAPLGHESVPLPKYLRNTRRGVVMWIFTVAAVIASAVVFAQSVGEENSRVVAQIIDPSASQLGIDAALTVGVAFRTVADASARSVLIGRYRHLS